MDRNLEKKFGVGLSENTDDGPNIRAPQVPSSHAPNTGSCTISSPLLLDDTANSPGFSSQDADTQAVEHSDNNVQFLNSPSYDAEIINHRDLQLSVDNSNAPDQPEIIVGDLGQIDNPPQKLKLYQKPPLEDEEQEKKRVCAVRSKKHRDGVKQKTKTLKQEFKQEKEEKKQEQKKKERERKQKEHERKKKEHERKQKEHERKKKEHERKKKEHERKQKEHERKKKEHERKQKEHERKKKEQVQEQLILMTAERDQLRQDLQMWNYIWNQVIQEATMQNEEQGEEENGL